MDAKLVTYTTEKLNKSEKSILSKRLYGYTDKSNNSQYTYKREGFLDRIKHIKVCNNTFVIEEKDFEPIQEELRKRKVTIKVWSVALKNF